MKKKILIKDPYAKREANKYASPVPSREFIIEFLQESAAPLDHVALCAEFDLKLDDEIEALRRRLIAMVRDGQLICTRRGDYGVVDRMNLIRGKVQGHRDGFGFVIPQDGGEDLYLSSRQMRKVFSGDDVLVRVAGIDHRGRKEASIVEVLQHNTQQIVGRYYEERGTHFVVPDSQRITQEILVPGDKVRGARPGQFVSVRITEQPSKKNRPVGEIVEVLGNHLAPGMEIDIAIRSHEIPYIWPEDVEIEAAALPHEVEEDSKSKRVDLRHLSFVTIDGEDAKDFDDAVYCEATKSSGFRLFVAIADVSHYVEVESALDREAIVRGNSVYFPEYVIPMLPEKLSNGLCSLKPHVDRLCMVCEMNITAAGRVSKFKFYEAVMHSRARLTYTEVGVILSTEPTEARKGMRELREQVIPQLEALHQLYKVLRIARDERGAIDFDTVETRIIFDDDRKIKQIVPVFRNDAHKLIEECMLCANVCAAKFLEAHELTCLYRVHEGPSGDKLLNLRQYLGELRLDLSGGKKPTPKDYQSLLASITERPDAHIIQTMMLRSMFQAVYVPENKGHFGLNYTAYTHFTSPIRRYPDLLVHRAIRHVIRSRQESKNVERVPGAKVIAKKNIFPYDVKSMLQLGEQCSMTERRADEATRDVVSWLKCEYLLERVGDEFDGQVSGVTGFGLFVELTDIYVEGLIHVTALKGDYYHYDPVKQRLQGERTGMSYHLGDRLRVRVIRVDLDDKKIDFELVGLEQTGRKMDRKSGKTAEQSTPARDTQALGTKGSSDKGKAKTGKGKSKAKFDSGDIKNTGAAKTKKKKSRHGKKKKQQKGAQPGVASQVRKRDPS